MSLLGSLQVKLRPLVLPHDREIRRAWRRPAERRMSYAFARRIPTERMIYRGTQTRRLWILVGEAPRQREDKRSIALHPEYFETSQAQLVFCRALLRVAQCELLDISRNIAENAGPPRQGHRRIAVRRVPDRFAS